MGKKGKKKSDTGGRKVLIAVAGGNTAQASSEGAQGSFRVKNPNGSNTLLETGQTHHIGGRIHHVGSAGLAPGVAQFLLGPNAKNIFGFGERQQESQLGQQRAFLSTMGGHRGRAPGRSLPQVGAGLYLKLTGRFVRGQHQRDRHYATHRWIIVALPMEIV